MRNLSFTLAIVLSGAVCTCQQLSRVTVVVVTPQGTPADSLVYVAGNHPALGDWNPGRVSLEKINDSLWQMTAGLPRGFEAEFKITRGSWNTQAMYERGVVPSNQRLVVAGDTTVVVKPLMWSDQIRAKGEGITGTVRYHRGLTGEGLRYTRDIVVWLPPSYAQTTSRRYPVLYMHDGQNVFDPSTSFAGYDWRADEVADSLIRRHQVEEMIIVGINNSPDRMIEYSDTEAGHAYAQFVVSRVKPLIDSTYRTKPDRANTAVMGSSMGGLISFLFVWWKPDVFSKAGCLSSVFDEGRSSILEQVESDPGVHKAFRVYMDCGGYGGERSLKPGMDEMVKRLTKKGYVEGKDFVGFFDPGADHSERAWAARLWRPMKFLFPCP